MQEAQQYSLIFKNTIISTLTLYYPSLHGSQNILTTLT